MFRLDALTQRELKQLEHELRKLEPIVAIEAQAEFVPVAASVANEARSRAPRLTGALRDSIDPGISGDDVAVSAGVPYAAIHNSGGRHPVFGRGSVVQVASHFMDAAVESHDRDFMDAAEQAVTSAARKIGFH